MAERSLGVRVLMHKSPFSVVVEELILPTSSYDFGWADGFRRARDIAMFTS
jgi:hypothetical protein